MEAPSLNIKITADTRDLTPELEKVTKDYKAAFARMQASTGGVGKSLNDLRKDYEKLGNVAGARDYLGVAAHDRLKAKIAETRQAYALLAKSGQLSGRELAQAHSKTIDRVQELQKATNG
jgi:hypothetical protein